MTKDQLKDLVKTYFNLTETEEVVATEEVVTETVTEETPETFETATELVEEELPTEELPIEEEVEVTEEPSMEDMISEIMAVVKAEIEAVKAEMDTLKVEIEMLKGEYGDMKTRYETITAEPASERTIPSAAKTDVQSFQETEILDKERFAAALAMVNKNKNK